MNPASDPRNPPELARALEQLYQAVDHHLKMRTAPSVLELENWAWRLRAASEYVGEVIAQQAVLEDELAAEALGEVLPTPTDDGGGGVLA